MANINSWALSNTTTGSVSFDDQSLKPQGRVTVNALTNDILAGWRQGKLHIVPDPSLSGIFAERITIDPAQFPIPVRIIGAGESLAPTPVIVDGGEVTIPPTVSMQVAIADRRRLLLRIKNTGNQTLWLGGTNVTDATSLIPVAPGEVYTERDAPSATMWGYVAANLSSEATTIRTQHIYTGVV